MASSTPSGGCPVDHAKAEAPKCPVDHTKTSESSSDHQPSLQAFMPRDKANALVNPSNNMPAVPEQTASSVQKQQLSTQRTVSSIPKADRYESAGPSECPALHDQAHSDKWIYPSEQMFFNAMKRKNWDPKEQDMKTVVPIHNIVNEQCWRHILEWEKMHENQCGGPKLLRFEGKAKDMTVKARLRSLVGYQLPFDRHDWTIDRCGKPVRYIIDFYEGKASSNDPSKPSFFLDVRPAVTVEGVWDRTRRLFGL